MIGQACGQSRRTTLHPAITVPADKQLKTQAMVSVAEVVEATDDKHACFKGGCLTHQGAGSASQTIEPLAKSGVEPFNESGVDHALLLGLTNQALHHLLVTLNNAPHHVEFTIHALFDYLDDGDVGPGNQLRVPLFVATMRQIESSNARDLAIWDRLVQSHEAFALASVEFLEEMVDRRVRIATTSARRRRSGASPGRCWTVWPAGCISTTRGITTHRWDGLPVRIHSFPIQGIRRVSIGTAMS